MALSVAPVAACQESRRPPNITTSAALSVPGNNKRKVEPRSGWLDTFNAPRWARTIPITAASPSPRPVNLVVKKGSKILACVSRLMPHPVSHTSRNT